LYLFKVKVENFNPNTNGNSLNLFLTFKGLIKLLYVSHSKNAEQFQDWANNILFTHQLGTQEETYILGASLLGVNHKTIKYVFITSLLVT